MAWYNPASWTVTDVAQGQRSMKYDPRTSGFADNPTVSGGGGGYGGGWGSPAPAPQGNMTTWGTGVGNSGGSRSGGSGSSGGRAAAPAIDQNAVNSLQSQRDMSQNAINSLGGSQNTALANLLGQFNNQNQRAQVQYDQNNQDYTKNTGRTKANFVNQLMLHLFQYYKVCKFVTSAFEWLDFPVQLNTVLLLAALIFFLYTILHKHGDDNSI